MKRYYMMFIICLLTTSNIVIAGKARTIVGKISQYECYDDVCMLSIVDAYGKDHSGVCDASLCQKWNELTDMPEVFKGKKVRVTIGKEFKKYGNNVDMGKADTFMKIQFINTSSEADSSKFPFVGARFFDFGDGTRYIITIKKNGMTTMKTAGPGVDFISTTDYSGKFRNPIKVRGYDIRYLFKDNKVYAVDANGKFTYDCGVFSGQVNGLCVADLNETTYGD